MAEDNAVLLHRLMLEKGDGSAKSRIFGSVDVTQSERWINSMFELATELAKHIEGEPFTEAVCEITASCPESSFAALKDLTVELMEAGLPAERLPEVLIETAQTCDADDIAKFAVLVKKTGLPVLLEALAGVNTGVNELLAADAAERLASIIINPPLPQTGAPSAPAAAPQLPGSREPGMV